MDEARKCTKEKLPGAVPDTRASSGSSDGCQRQITTNASHSSESPTDKSKDSSDTLRASPCNQNAHHNLISAETNLPPNANVTSKAKIDMKQNFHNCVEEDDDEGELFARNINGIILQYLESCGLHEAYIAFYDECKSSGMLIPDHFGADIDRGISMQDVETLLMHFDQENGDALLEFWDVLTSMVDLDGQSNNDIEKITFYIQVYIALIPFRQKLGEEKKTSSMVKLKEYFQTKSEACTMDKEMLSLFALPFVPDPETHPVFGPLFQAAWIKKLRSRIKNLARALCSPSRLMTRENTDLAKMFRTCSNAIPHEITSNDGKKVCIMSNTEPVCFTSGVAVSPSTTNSDIDPDEFNPSQLFQRMNELILENERFKAEESKYEKQCSQLLNVSILLAQSLEEAAQGKEVNMEHLRHEVNQCLPVSVAKKKNEAQNPPERQLSCSETASTEDSDASDSNILRDPIQNASKRGPKHKMI